MQFIKSLILLAAAVAAVPTPPAGLTFDALPEGAIPLDAPEAATESKRDTSALDMYKRETYNWIKREVSEDQAEAYKRETYNWIKRDPAYGSSY
ncbi:hypothetical protein UCREL1_10460 [Eutypa lata UCREL1]|uniref:Uncharacterized protein n=1 Tax=Eutypa lata (strain UCR-EL1) TaxID=1287681 RepID=M7SYI7_EUTLA|nr:hypothetical protein UCREL1_10460 [Eutypa lata UCREL1]